MAGLSKEVCFCIARIRSRFVDTTGHIRSGIATGTWIQTDKNNRIFVVNAHTLDISMKYRLAENPKLISLEIELRKKENNIFTKATKYFPIDLDKTRIIRGSEVDLALVINPYFSEDISGYSNPSALNSLWIADEDFFIQRSRISSDVSFLGYPMNLCDDQWMLPIARHAIIASVSEIDFSHKDINYKKTILVSGLSFAGGSGSPVFSCLRGMQIKGNIGSAESDDYCPQKFLGIMSGHLQLPPEEKLVQKESEFTRHTGLSYFTKSSALLEILQSEDL